MMISWCSNKDCPDAFKTIKYWEKANGISDFDSAMRSSMNISAIFRTKYEGDLDSIGRTLGSDFAKIVPSLPIGNSIFHSADLGTPFVMTWRPLYSQP
jgi:hypothetical protein